MISLTPLYAIAGVAFVSKFVEDFMSDAGKGNWVWLVKTVMYCGVGLFALSTWHGYVVQIASVFGVSVP